MASLEWAGLSQDWEEDVPECSGRKKFGTQKMRLGTQTSTFLGPNKKFENVIYRNEV